MKRLPFKAVVMNMMDAAKVNLYHDGYLEGVALLFREGEMEVVPLSLTSFENKVMLQSAFKQRVRKTDVDSVIIIADAWHTIISEDNKEGLAKAKREGLDKHPNRQEVIFVAGATKNGERIAITQEYNRVGGTIIFGKECRSSPKKGDDGYDQWLDGLWDTIQ